MPRKFSAAVIASVAALALTASAIEAKPPGHPPRVSGVKAAPPPAWAETGSKARWLAYGSYCWSTVCANMLPPATRPDLPVLPLSRQRIVRINLAFRPTSLSVRILTGTKTGPLTKLPPRAVVDWHPQSTGVAVFDARSARGSATYLLRLTRS